jgi:hypothetical protein
MGRRNPRPNVEWVGLIVRTDDGQVHAVEMDGRAGRVTADLAIDNGTRGMYISAVIQGRGAYWHEGENLGPDVQTRRALRPGNIRPQSVEEYAAIQAAIIEGVIGEEDASNT